MTKHVVEIETNESVNTLTGEIQRNFRVGSDLEKAMAAPGPKQPTIDVELVDESNRTRSIWLGNDATGDRIDREFSMWQDKLIDAEEAGDERGVFVARANLGRLEVAAAYEDRLRAEQAQREAGRAQLAQVEAALDEAILREEREKELIAARRRALGLPPV